MNYIHLMIVLAYAYNTTINLPNPLPVQEIQNNLVKVSLFLGIISSIAVIISAIVAFVQWKKTKKFHRIEYIQNLRSKMYDDKDIAEVLYMFDYDLPWYSADFHNTKHPQIEVDKTLSFLEYACYLLNKKLIEKEDMFQIKYDIDRAIGNFQVQDYLYNLNHWTKRSGTQISFPNFLQYGQDNGFISKDFEETDNSKYHKYLNY